ncbi:MAG: hypothetical protein AAF648_15045 [Pseudomonadota bacterium]
MYRYLNSDGIVVMASSIPNDRVPLGYEVIDSRSGRVLELVAPQLTPEEARAKAEFERRFDLCMASKRRVLAMYESTEDIDAAERQAMESLENRVLNTQANLSHVQNQLRDFEAQAARQERSGAAVGPTLVGNIERARFQIANLEEQIAARRREQEALRKDYARDRVVFALGECEEAAYHALFDATADELSVTADEPSVTADEHPMPATTPVSALPTAIE